MTLGTILTFIGLLLTSYSFLRHDRRAVILTFVPLWSIIGIIAISAVAVLYPFVLELRAIHVSRADTAVSEVFSFLLLVGTLGYFLARVRWPFLGPWSSDRFRNVIPTALIEQDWNGLRAILRSNSSGLVRHLRVESLQAIYDPRFIRAMTDNGDWLHLELLSQEEAWKSESRWKFLAADAVGRAMLEGKSTLHSCSVKAAI